MFKAISESQIFRGLTVPDVEALFEGIEYSVKPCSEGDLVSLGGTRCNSMMILVEGKLRCEAARSGTKIETITAPALVSSAFLYATENILPVTTVSESVAEIVIIPRAAFSLLLTKDTRVLDNFLHLLSDGNKPITGKLVFFGFKNIKSKFANLLLEQSEVEDSLNLKLKYSQREMAEMFGVTRPALARAIGEMAADGAIFVNRKNITIAFREKLKQYAAK